MKSILFLLSFLLVVLSGFPQNSDLPDTGKKSPRDFWVDSVYRSLTIDQRIAQLLMIRAFSDRDSLYNDSLTNLIRTWNVGGICFFKGTPYHQATLTNIWQENVKTPLLIAIDAEWGMGMRLDSAFAFPRPMTLGAIEDDSLIYQMARAIGQDCKRLGVHMNFAPVVDINNNSSNPVIGFRSFGEDKLDVARKGYFYMKGLQDEGIIAVAKHFPGHGNTDQDSHYALPVLQQSVAELDSVELYPFKELISKGVDGVMIGHLFTPAFDSTVNTASTLSSKVVDNLLRKNLGFNGCIVTDALDMKGVTKFNKPGETELKAFKAGNDLLLLPPDVPAAIRTIREACDSSEILLSMLEQKCRKILSLKYKAGLSKLTKVSLGNLYQDLNSAAYRFLNRKIYQSAVSLIKNEDQLVPLKFLDRRRIAVLSVGELNQTVFQKTSRLYSPLVNFNLRNDFKVSELDSVKKLLKESDLVILAFHCGSSLPSSNYGIPSLSQMLIDSLARHSRIILNILGSPYAVNSLSNTKNIQTLLISFLDTPDAEEASAQIIFGGLPAIGHLPVSVSPEFPVHTEIITEPTRIEFALPEDLGIPSVTFKSIDSIAVSGVANKAYPGCQIIFVKDGRLFYQKSFGTPRYGDTVMVRNDDLYDIASLTKVMATTLAIMCLYEKGKISLDGRLGDYLSELRRTNKANLTIREVMTHQAGLQPWIRFYKEMIKDGKPDPEFFRSDSTEKFPVRVAKGMFTSKVIADSILQQIIRSPLRDVKDYKYSDLGFYLLKLIVERTSGESFESLLNREFYHPLGLQTICFHPFNKFPPSRIIPTEFDSEFRNQQLWGDVHDQGAALLGGISGHAGLFSDAADLAVIMQMLLNDGYYGSKQYLLPSTIREFTKVQFPESGNRRALGFDKPLLQNSPDGPSCQSVSSESFGHSGFTGTYLWADPANNLIYIFLSNRIYPSTENNRLAEMNIRTRIHQQMYEILNTLNKK